MTILVVEDSSESLELVAGYLETQGARVLRAADAATMKAVLATEYPSIILLDVNLPDGDGISLARELRLSERCGLIFVTARDGDEDLITALAAGGDDYVVKPVNLPALYARIGSVLRRAGRTLITFNGWNLDLIRREVFRPDGSLLELTTGEINILAALAAQRPQPVSRDYLLDVISNRDPRRVSGHTVDTLVARLRRKMGTGDGTPLIRTVRGIGYALVPSGGASGG